MSNSLHLGSLWDQTVQDLKSTLNGCDAVFLLRVHLLAGISVSRKTEISQLIDESPSKSLVVPREVYKPKLTSNSFMNTY